MLFGLATNSMSSETLSAGYGVGLDDRDWDWAELGNGWRRHSDSIDDSAIRQPQAEHRRTDVASRSE
jgi:hypothetical protein